MKLFLLIVIATMLFPFLIGGVSASTYLPTPSVDVPKFLVTSVVPFCTVTAISTDADCWSLTSGGVGGAGVPDSDDTAFMDAMSGSTHGMDAAFTIGILDMFGYIGTLTTNGFDINTANNVLFAGTVIATTSDITAVGTIRSDGTTTFTTAFISTQTEVTIAGTLTLGASSITTKSFYLYASGVFNVGTTVVTFDSADPTFIGNSNSNAYNLVFADVRFAGAGTKSFGDDGFNGPITTGSVTTAGASPITIMIIEGVDWTIGTGKTITGSSVAPITLDSPTPTWTLIAGAGVTASFVTVSNSDASGGSTIDATDGTNTDAGGNTNWNFSPPCSFGPFGTTIDILLPLLITASLLLLIVIILIGSKESSRSKGTSFSTIFVVINLIIIIVITAALIPNIHVC